MRMRPCLRPRPRLITRNIHTRTIELAHRGDYDGLRERLEELEADRSAAAASAGRMMQGSIARYAGRPELMLQENPHRNFVDPPKPQD
jgi:hypothetical protein